MYIKTEDLQSEFITKTRLYISKVENFRKNTDAALNYKKNTDSWSVLECIEHLNLYGNFYIPEITKQIHKTKSKPYQFFKSGIIGDYFVKSMLPKEKLNKMKTAIDMNPLGSNLDYKVIHQFIAQQVQFLELIENSKNINLNKTKTAISISKLIKLRLGDTFRFVIAHNDRHLIQAENVLKEIL